MRFRVLVCAIAVLLSLSAGYGQSADLVNDSPVLASLDGQWRFHAGDDSAWANPAFNDSSWSLVRATDGWAAAGYKGYAGLGWYRISIALPQKHRPLALYVTECDVSCQYFANGQQIGQLGGLPPHPYRELQFRSIYAIPENLTRGSRLVLAVRVWNPMNTGASGGGAVEAQVGEAGAAGKMRDYEGWEIAWENTFSTVELFGNLIAGASCLVLFTMRRKEREYLWFGLYLLTWTAYLALNTYARFHLILFSPFQFAMGVLFELGTYLPFEFYLAFLRRRRDRLYWSGVLLLAAGLAANIAYGIHPNSTFLAISNGTEMGVDIVWILMFVSSWKKGMKEAMALVVVQSFRALMGNGPWLLSLIGLGGPDSFAAHFNAYYRNGVQWPFPINGAQFMGDLFNLVVLILVIGRYARSRQDEDRLESELEAARTVQSVLVPAETPSIPGFDIEAVYFPAGEVGGDFFQIIATPGGGALVAIGDVSGKGMPAAMTVSLLVGTLRTLAHYTESPGEILAAMNQRMLARSAGGFTTCLVLRADASGRLTAANAGHVPAYVGGHELPIENGFPLGLVEDAAYRESQSKVAEGEQITLVTDGVPEAMNERRELFGFERTARISTSSASAIAETARGFGQHDDVTVVRLAYKPGAVAGALRAPIAGPMPASV